MQSMFPILQSSETLTSSSDPLAESEKVIITARYSNQNIDFSFALTTLD